MSSDVAFFKTTMFSLSSTVTSPGEDDDLLVYYVSLLSLTPTPIFVKPPITQIYSRSQNFLVSSQTPAASTLDPVSNDDLPIALRIGKHQCVHLISSFCSYNRLSSHSCSFIASVDSISLPKTVCEALSHPSWRSAIVKEMQALDDNGTWNLVQFTCWEENIGWFWVFFVLVNPDGSVA